MHQLPCLKLDWLNGIRLFLLKNSNILLYSKRSSLFPHIESNETGRQFRDTCLSPFLWTRTTFPLFNSVGIFRVRGPFPIQDLTIDSPQSYLKLSLLLNDIDQITFSIHFKNCSGKKELNISAFSLKLVTYLFW